LHEQRSQIRIATSGDTAQAWLAAGGVLARGQSEPRGELTPATELLRVDHRGGERAGGERTDAAQADQALRARVVLRVACDVAIALGEVALELTQVGELASDALA
jgi:hypothetical protein